MRWPRAFLAALLLLGATQPFTTVGAQDNSTLPACAAVNDGTVAHLDKDLPGAKPLLYVADEYGDAFNPAHAYLFNPNPHGTGEDFTAFWNIGVRVVGQAPQRPCRIDVDVELDIFPLIAGVADTPIRRDLVGTIRINEGDQIGDVNGNTGTNFSVPLRMATSGSGSPQGIEYNSVTGLGAGSVIFTHAMTVTLRTDPADGLVGGVPTEQELDMIPQSDMPRVLFGPLPRLTIREGTSAVPSVVVHNLANTPPDEVWDPRANRYTHVDDVNHEIRVNATVVRSDPWLEDAAAFEPMYPAGKYQITTRVGGVDRTIDMIPARETSYGVEWKFVPKDSGYANVRTIANISTLGSLNIVPSEGQQAALAGKVRPNARALFPSSFELGPGPWYASTKEYSVRGPDLEFSKKPVLSLQSGALDCLTTAQQCDPSSTTFTVTPGWEVRNKAGSSSLPGDAVQAQWHPNFDTVGVAPPERLNVSLVVESGGERHVLSQKHKERVPLAEGAVIAPTGTWTGALPPTIGGKPAAQVLQGATVLRVMIDEKNRFAERDESMNSNAVSTTFYFADNTPPQLTGITILGPGGADTQANGEGLMEGAAGTLQLKITEPGPLTGLNVTVRGVDSPDWSRTYSIECGLLADPACVSLVCAPGSGIYTCTAPIKVEGEDVLLKVVEAFEATIYMEDQNRINDTTKRTLFAHGYWKETFGCIRADWPAGSNTMAPVVYGAPAFAAAANNNDPTNPDQTISFQGSWTAPANHFHLLLMLHDDETGVNAATENHGHNNDHMARGLSNEVNDAQGLGLRLIAPSGRELGTDLAVAPVGENGRRSVSGTDASQPGSAGTQRDMVCGAEATTIESHSDPAYEFDSIVQEMPLDEIGTWTLELNVTDVNGKTNTTNLHIMIEDLTPPTIEQANCVIPSGGVVVGNTVACSAVANDDIHVKRVFTRFTHDDATLDPIEINHTRGDDVAAPTDGGTYRLQATTGRTTADGARGQLPYAGHYDVSIVVEDEFGTETAFEIEAGLTILDVTQPTVSIRTNYGELDGLEIEAVGALDFEVRVQDETLEKSATLVLKRGTDTETVTLTRDDRLVWKGNLTVTGLLGTWEATATVLDHNGNMGTKTVSFSIVQDTFPQAILRNPTLKDADGRGVLSPGRDLTVDLIDPGSGVDAASVEVWLDGDRIDVAKVPVSEPSPRLRIGFTPALTAADHLKELTLRIDSADQAGKSGTRTIDLIVDAAGPVATVNVQPKAGDDTVRVGPTSQVTVATTDAPAGVQGTQLTITAGTFTQGQIAAVGEPLHQGTYTGAVSFRDIPGLADGDQDLPLVIEAVGTDRAGNRGDAASLAVVLDRRGPDLKLASQGASEDLRYDVEDPAGVRGVSVEYWAEGRARTAKAFTLVTGNTWGVTLPVFSKGTTVNFEVRAEDSFGNVAQDVVRSFVAGNSPPTVRIERPTDGRSVTGTMTVEWVAGDLETDVEDLTFSLLYRSTGASNVTLLTDVKGSSASVDTRQLPNGQGVLTVLVNDGSRIGQDQVTIVVSNLPDPVTDVKAPATSRPGEEIRLEVTLASEASRVTAIIRHDATGAEVARTNLFDDGQGVDVNSADGTWTGTVVLNDAGRYTVDVEMDTPDGPITRERAATLEVSGAENGPKFGPAVVILGLATLVVVGLGVVALRRRP